MRPRKSVRSHLENLGRSLAVVAVVAAAAACSPAEIDDPEAERRAEELVAAAQAAGLAPRLTADAAVWLYDKDAEELCAVLDDGAASGSQILLRGNPALGRRKAITEDAVEFGRVVVATYCPEELSNYEEFIADIEPIEVSR